MAKIKYEKPKGVDLGEVAPVRGLTCIAPGNDPSAVPYCPPGNVATGNCQTGTTANQVCWTSGSKAAGCLSTGSIPG